jgi:hypothetical protein
VIPKGWPQQDQPDHVTASQEALEEAGVTGVVLPRSIGSYLYRKRLPTETIDVRVRVFMLNCTGELASWRESDERQRLWCGGRQQGRGARAAAAVTQRRMDVTAAVSWVSFCRTRSGTHQRSTGRGVPTMGWKVLLQIARVFTWLLWAAFIGFGIHFISDRAPHLTAMRQLKPHAEALMFVLPVAAVVMGMVQLMVKERIHGSIDATKR